MSAEFHGVSKLKFLNVLVLHFASHACTVLVFHSERMSSLIAVSRSYSSLSELGSETECGPVIVSLDRENKKQDCKMLLQHLNTESIQTVSAFTKVSQQSNLSFVQ